AGLYTMCDTVGQSMADTMSGGLYHVAFGFWAMDAYPPPPPEVNYSPLARPNTMSARLNTPSQTGTDRLLANDLDEDADPLYVISVSSPSAEGGTVVLENNTVTYTPRLDFLGTDSFTYSITDGRGGFATATVFVTVTAGGPIARRIQVIDSAVVIHFAGVPGWSYTVERAMDINGPWALIGTAIAPSEGVFTFVDNDPPGPAAYYRLSQRH
ncbi:MAG TPA: cadherin-like domain-containing protein, partial [Verrucomicrobiota bacterium]|nr:cadherin-like domain-containing protein [Verrucomicrobiota bacterium]